MEPSILQVKTQRLVLRPMRESDERAFLLGMEDGELRRLYGLPPRMSQEQRGRLFRRFCDLGAHGIYEKSTDQLTGFILDVPPELPEEKAKKLPAPGRTFAFATFTPFRRRGYMTEALTELIAYLFTERGICYIHCGHFPENIASAALLKKLGFRPMGEHTFGENTVVDQICFKQESIRKNSE